MNWRLFLSGAAFAAVGAVNALDTNQDNDYWNTSGYVNAPVSVATVVTTAAFDSTLEVSSPSSALSRFCTHPVAMAIVIR